MGDTTVLSSSSVKMSFGMMLMGLSSSVLANENMRATLCDYSAECLEKKYEDTSAQKKKYFATLRMPRHIILSEEIVEKVTLTFCSDIEVDKWEIKYVDLSIEKSDNSMLIPLTDVKALFRFDHQLELHYLKFPEIGEWNIIVKAEVNGQDFEQKIGKIVVE